MAKKASKKVSKRPSSSSGSKSMARPAAKPAKGAKPTGKPTAKPAAKKPAAKPSSRPSGKPASKPAAKPAMKAAPKPAQKPAPKPVQKPVQKPVKKPAKNRPARAETPLDVVPAPAFIPEPLPPAPSGPITKTSIDEARAFAIEAARLMSDDKCVDIVVLDVTALTSVSDFIVIGTGTSDRQMRSTLGDITELGRNSGHQVARRSEDDRATWVLADFVDVVCHLFEPNTRAYYDLEMMWGDAPRIDWSRAPGDKPKVRNERVVE